MKSISLSTKKIAYTALLSAAAVVLNIFSLPIMDNSIKISFTYIICFVAGAFLGPFAGLLTGLVGDILGMLIAPTGGPWVPLITVSSAFLGLIPGIIFKLNGIKPLIKILISYVLVFLICTAGLTSLGIYTMFIAKTGKTFWVFLIGRLPAQSIIVAVNAVLSLIIYYPLKLTVFKKGV